MQKWLCYSSETRFLSKQPWLFRIHFIEQIGLQLLALPPERPHLAQSKFPESHSDTKFLFLEQRLRPFISLHSGCQFHFSVNEVNITLPIQKVKETGDSGNIKA